MNRRLRNSRWFVMGPIVKDTGTNQEIADCRSCWTKTGDPNIEVPQSEENARLIAAAPRLYDAALRALDLIDQGEFPEHLQPMIGHIRQVLHDLQEDI